MTATNHVLTGALVGLTIHQPFATIPIALLSHFALDALPHYGAKNHTGRHFKVVLLGDTTIASILLLVLIILQPAHWLLAVLCGIAAASPDLMWLPGWLRELTLAQKRKPNLILRFHKNIQWGEKPQNYSYELVWASICLFGLVKLI